MKPQWVVGRAAEIFEQYAGFGFWLTVCESALLATWASLSVEVEQGIATMPASRIATWRTLSNDLGFDPRARSQLGIYPTPSAKIVPDPAERFFTKR